MFVSAARIKLILTECSRLLNFVYQYCSFIECLKFNNVNCFY